MSLSVSVLLLMYAYTNMMVCIQYTTMKSVTVLLLMVFIQYASKKSFTVLKCMLVGSDL